MTALTAPRPCDRADLRDSQAGAMLIQMCNYITADVLHNLILVNPPGSRINGISPGFQIAYYNILRHFSHAQVVKRGVLVRPVLEAG